MNIIRLRDGATIATLSGVLGTAVSGTLLPSQSAAPTTTAPVLRFDDPTLTYLDPRDQPI
jgi:hypothetical protein